MPSIIKESNAEQTSSTQSVKGLPAEQTKISRRPTPDQVDAFKRYFNKASSKEAQVRPQDNQTHSKNTKKENTDATASAFFGVGLPLNTFDLPAAADTPVGASSTVSKLAEAALNALEHETYAGALVTRSESVAGHLHVRVHNGQFAGVEIVVTLGHEEKRRESQRIHMEIRSKNVEQYDAFINASKKLLNDAKFSGLSMDVQLDRS